MLSSQSSAKITAMPHAQWLTPQLIPLVNQFYRSQNQKDKARKDEKVAVIRAENNAIIAAVRLNSDGEGQLLRALYVAQSHQRQGLARALMQFVLAEQSQALWCFARADLTDFYLSLGFTQISVADCPADLAARFRAYCRYQTLSLLRFIPDEVKKISKQI